jgi:hypothetical protein
MSDGASATSGTNNGVHALQQTSSIVQPSPHLLADFFDNTPSVTLPRSFPDAARHDAISNQIAVNIVVYVFRRYVNI